MSEQAPIVIDTPDGIAHFQMARIIAALRIQVNTGMTLSRGSLVVQCRRSYGTTKNTVKGVLKEMEAKYEEKYGRAYGS